MAINLVDDYDTGIFSRRNLIQESYREIGVVSSNPDIEQSMSFSVQSNIGTSFDGDVVFHIRGNDVSLSSLLERIEQMESIISSLEDRISELEFGEE
jgi:hypothetical protein